MPVVIERTTKLRCTRCGHIWTPQDSKTKPKTCANKKCKSPYWNNEKGILRRGRPPKT